MMEDKLDGLTTSVSSHPPTSIFRKKTRKLHETSKKIFWTANVKRKRGRPKTTWRRTTES
jgi:hypothetical protein